MAPPPVNAVTVRRLAMQKEAIMGKSYERDGFFGKYTEHYDDDGNKIGESRERDGFFGKYVEHTDADGSKIGESRDREGFLGSYTEHTDASGSKTGESRERDGFFGSYSEHANRSGDKTGESREREGLFGRYTEHEGTGYRGDDSKKDSGSSSGCFLVTACARAKGLPDSCSELSTLRQFRDSYVAALPEGPALIALYYRVAPAIIAELDNAPDSDRLYDTIFRQLETAVECIEANRPHEALEIYQAMVAILAERLVGANAMGLGNSQATPASSNPSACSDQPASLVAAEAS
jgi:hypothetical protein